MWVTLEADSGGSPSGTPLATSDKMDASLVGNTGVDQTLRFAFRTPYTDTTSQVVWIVLQGDYTRSDANFVTWRGVVAGGFAGGSSKDFNGTSWSATPGANGLDRDFRYWHEASTSVTMPSGYTKRCKVGYVFSDSAGNMRQFEARDNVIRHSFLAVVSGATTDIPALADLNTHVPAGPIDVLLGALGNTSADQWSVNPAPFGYDTTQRYVNLVVATGTTATGSLYVNQWMPMDLQSLFWWRNAGAGALFLYVWGYRW
jgi:hypothetical protein